MVLQPEQVGLDDAAPTPSGRRSFAGRTLPALRGHRWVHWLTAPSVLILLVFAIAAIFAPLIAPYNPSADLTASGTPRRSAKRTTTTSKPRCRPRNWRAASAG